jgi:acetyl-CoA/propionyl-CoA carboxylase biotin carboxyl carrier protein
MFGTVLVANRGEIACRIIGTLRGLGIRSVAIYSDADRDARHVGLADVALRIGPAAAQHSYLDGTAVIAAAVQSGAEAIHPGYGFLSENAEFARACAEAGIVFIGPGIDALEIMGDKIRAKEEVSSRGVAVIAGSAGLDDAGLAAAASGIGFPLLVKPSAGGGGKGMQIVRSAAELPEALVAGRRIAAAAFGDDTLLLERYLDTPRHIEVQVLADAHGGVVHLGERECSLQRRHQKVIEEAPSPLLDAATRVRIGEAACEVARSVEYRGAGTVEFLVAAAAPKDFFFIEMNTRLQVEHPVTELVTGIDLVEAQLRIAAGEPLWFGQEDVMLDGHAIEARVYAESPARDFVPSTGTVLALHEATAVRVDSSLREGLTIGGDYDPMLAKVIAHGATRAEALRRLDAALAETVVLGVHTNVEFLRALLAEPGVRAGDLDTGLIERALPDIRFHLADDHDLAAAALTVHAERWTGSLWQRPSGWRIGDARAARYVFASDATTTVEVRVSGAPDAATVAIGDGEPRPAHLSRLPDHRVAVEVDGVSRVLTVARDGASLWIGDSGAAVTLVLRSREERLAALLAARGRVEGAVDPELRSPMPGSVVSVAVATGDSVVAGQLLLSVEAMKMEHRLRAPLDGIVIVTVTQGDQVTLDQVVASIRPHEGQSAEGQSAEGLSTEQEPTA